MEQERDVDLSFLPAVNASLNGLSTVLLVVGLVLIKMGKRDAHKKAMLGAFISSGVFLVFYLIHYFWRAKVKGGVHTVYDGPMGKPFYYGLLISHILLAIFVPVLAIVLIRLGLKERYETHKKVARFAWPIWFYVSVTGVVIYFMLYHFNGPGKVENAAVKTENAPLVIYPADTIQRESKAPGAFEYQLPALKEPAATAPVK